MQEVLWVELGSEKNGNWEWLADTHTIVPQGKMIYTNNFKVLGIATILDGVTVCESLAL